MELWDVLDRDGNKKGRVMIRGDEIQTGDYHLVVHVWIRNEKGEYLVQKRADDVELWPGVWATTGGSVVAGEHSLEAVVREVREEMNLALDSSTLRRLMRQTRTTSIVDVWFAELESDDAKDSHPGPEVSEIAWLSKQQIQDMIDQGRFFPYDYFGILPD